MRGNRSNHPIEPPYCDGCFLECAKLSKTFRSGGYPCSPELRKLAKEHRDDEGDVNGYVWSYNVRYNK